MMTQKKWITIILMLCLLGYGSGVWAMEDKEETVTGRLYSDNQIQDAVIAGNQVYFEMIVPEGTVVKEGMIGRKPVEFVKTEKDGCLCFQGTITVDSSDFSEGERFSAKALLVMGDQSIVYTSKESLVYYAPPEILNLTWQSKNTNPLLIKNGENLMVSCKVSHPSRVRVFAAGREVSMQLEDEQYCHGMIQADGLVEDQKKIPLKVVVSDLFGNQPVVSEIETAQYFAPLVLYELNQESTNQKDPQTYLIDADQLILKGKINHDAKIDLKSGGQILEDRFVKSDFELNLPASQFEKEDQKSPAFEMTIQDAAGNCIKGIDGTVCSKQLCYYAPITHRTETQSPDCQTIGYVKNGMSLYSEIETNHKVRMIRADYAGRPGMMERERGNTVGFSYKISSQEEKMEEGEIYLKAFLEDVAGNTKMIEEKTGWIYDRTAPIGIIDPQRQGFFNENLEFRIQFKDSGLDLESFELEMNDQRQRLKTRQIPEGAEATFSLKKEGQYRCVCTASDLAGNRSEPCDLKVVIDKTSPQIVGIDIETNRKPIYRSGFVLSEHFKVKDLYLKEICCTLSDRWGFGRTKTWNMDRPIMEDGLKKASFMATDLASNVSEKMTYEFYIDGTAPAIKVKDKAKEKRIEGGACISKGTVLEITLDPRWFQETNPDRFERVWGKIGERDFEFDQKALEKSTLQLKADVIGDLELNIIAADEVGNRTREKMTLSVKEKERLKDLTKDPLPIERENIAKNSFMIAVIAGCAASLLIGCGFLLKKHFIKNKR